VLFLVGFMESISISKALARRHGYRVNVTQEIFAMGMANLIGGMFSAYPATGSFSRSAVSADVGGKTPLQGIITGARPSLVGGRSNICHMLGVFSRCGIQQP
jgi:MFS superfamily sulfate permease-like transporter